MTGRDPVLTRMVIADVIVRERMARDDRAWDEMANYYHPSATVEVSWFEGSGAEFVARSRANVRDDLVSLHVLSPPVVTVHEDRAIAETPCTLRGFTEYEGAAVSVESFVRLVSRARRSGDRWMIAGLRCIYIRDLLIACNPSHPPVLDQDRLAGYRASYRFMSYHLSSLGLAPSDDLPGVDRPASVLALRAAEREWLNAGTSR